MDRWQLEGADEGKCMCDDYLIRSGILTASLRFFSLQLQDTSHPWWSMLSWHSWTLVTSPAETLSIPPLLNSFATLLRLFTNCMMYSSTQGFVEHSHFPASMLWSTFIIPYISSGPLTDSARPSLNQSTFRQQSILGEGPVEIILSIKCSGPSIIWTRCRHYIGVWRAAGCWKGFAVVRHPCLATVCS